VTASGLPAVTVLIDKDDHPTWTAAAHAAHDPAMGRLTVDPSPANGAPAALAHDLLYALGKRLPTGGKTYGTWADSQRPAWNAVHNGQQLHLTATGIRYHLKPAP
jgi:hypothetical protein